MFTSLLWAEHNYIYWQSVGRTEQLVEYVFLVKCGQKIYLPINCGQNIYFTSPLWAEQIFISQLYAENIFSSPMCAEYIFASPIVGRLYIY